MVGLDVLTQVKKIVSKTLKISLEKLDVDDDFDNFGMDSIIAMELMSNLSKEMNISITPAQFTEVSTIKELASSIEQVANANKNPVVEAPVVNIEKEKEIPQKQVNIEAKQILKQRQQVPTSRSNGAMHKDVLEKISQEFSIDLSYRKFSSIEDIADTLVSNHLGELLSHYGILEEATEPHYVENTREVKNTETAGKVDLDDIAIVGISCNFPDAPNTTTYWNNLMEQKNSMREIPVTRWDWKDNYANVATEGKTTSKWAALIDHHDCFDAAFFEITPEEAKLMDPQERLLLQEVYKSFQDAGINPKELKGTNTGVYTSYEYSEYEHYLRNNVDHLEVENKPFFSSSSPTYYLSNRLSFLFDFNGPSETFNVNCAGSAVAVNRAYHSLLDGESDVAVVGGVSLNLFADDYIALSKYEMLSPNGTCAVFDDNANGFTRGEGAASVVLKRLSDAEKDNNKIYGIIKNSNQNNRGKARFMQEIDIESITNVISECYKKVGIDPASVHYIEVDGYATKWADSFEYEGVKKVFSKVESKDKSCALGSLKGNIGNLESVNGLASLIKLSLSMYNKKFPATITKKKTNAFIDIDNKNHPLYIADSEIPFDSIRKDEDSLIRAGINSFADTGVNVHILLEEYNKKNVDLDAETSSQPQLFILSAKDKDRLIESVNNYIEHFSNTDNTSFAETIYTLQTGREAMEERLAIVASSFQELLKKLNTAKNSFSQKKISLDKEGIFYASANQADENPLKGIFNDDMAKMLIEDTQQADRLQKLAKLWIIGLDIPWKLLWKNQAIRPTSLPLYPFYKDRYWAELSGNAKLTPKPTLNGKQSQPKAVAKVEIKKKDVQPAWFIYMAEGETNEEHSFSSIEKIELYLQQQIATLLKSSASDIQKDVNFLELGLNSIDIGTFVSNTMNLLNVRLSPAIIFSNVDIHSLSKYLNDTYPEKIASLSVTKDAQKAHNAANVGTASDILDSESVLIPLQTNGTQTPIFAVSPGGNGTTLAFQHLVQAFGSDQPFYGLEFVMNSDESDTITIESIAATNIEAIQEVQPKGPYRFLGLSNGGMVAFEMAKVLITKGEKIELLSFLDCFSPSQQVLDMEDEIVGVFNGKFSTSSEESLDLNVDKLKALPEEDRFEYLYKSITDYGFTIPKEQFETTYKIARTMDGSCRAYKPSKLTRKINSVLFRANEAYMDGYKKLPQDYGWNKLFSNKIQINPIEANHFSITDKEPSIQIATAINKLLEKSPKRKTNS